MNLVDPSYELIDPCPDIHALFIDYNSRFFHGVLVACEVKWSPRMTTCAGICCYEPRSGMCSIRLSKPLLTLRPRKDLVETLLHEMIHAFLFITERNQDRDGHGPEFQYHMHRINSIAGTKITIYHSFHAEVKLYKVHHWRCEGPCRDRGPFRGWVKRASNRAPGPNDIWWAQHQLTCGGKFVKVSEPPDYKSKKKPSEFKGKGKTSGTLDKWITSPVKEPTKGKRAAKKKPTGSKVTPGTTPNTLDGWVISPDKKPGLFGGKSENPGDSHTSSSSQESGGTRLGGSTNGRSRLLDLYDNKPSEKKQQIDVRSVGSSSTDPIVIDDDDEFWLHEDEHPTMDEWVPGGGGGGGSSSNVNLDESRLQIVNCPNCGVEEYHLYIEQHLLQCTSH